MAAAATVSPHAGEAVGFACPAASPPWPGGLLRVPPPGFVATGAESPFSPEASLQLVAIAIIGGIGTVAGPILGAIWVVGIPAAFGASDAAQLLSADVGLLILLLYFPGGLVQVLYAAATLLLKVLAGTPAADAAGARQRAAPAGPPGDGPRVPPDGVPWLATRGVGVRFGGVHAVERVIDRGGDAASSSGSSAPTARASPTLMNAISGFVPHVGAVELLGSDIRAPLGPPRTPRPGPGLPGRRACSRPSPSARRCWSRSRPASARARVVDARASRRRTRGSGGSGAEADEIMAYLGLGRSPTRSSPTSPRAPAASWSWPACSRPTPKVLLLDEPTGGIAQRRPRRSPR